MITFFVCITLMLYIVFAWRKRTIQANKPSWAIDYATYFLADVFCGLSREDALKCIYLASQSGLPKQLSQSDLVHLKAYKAYANRLTSNDVSINKYLIMSLSDAVAIEARLALHSATARPNIDHYLSELHPNMSDTEIQNAGTKLFLAVREPAQQGNDNDAVCALYELTKHFIMGSFERRHQTDIYSFSHQISNELVAVTFSKEELVTLEKLGIKNAIIRRH